MAARKAREPKAAKAPRASRRKAQAKAQPEAAPEEGWTPEPMAAGEGRDYLVIYEEPDEDGLPADDALVIDLEGPRATSLGELDVEQKLDLQLTNRTNRVGTFGFIISCVGGVAGLILLVAFALTYPERWYDDNLRVSGAAFVRSMVFFSSLTLLLLVAGTILTHYGRRIQAHGNLSAVRIVEKERQPRAFLE